jgi:hypothetical protein
MQTSIDFMAMHVCMLYNFKGFVDMHNFNKAQIIKYPPQMAAPCRLPAPL